MTLKLSFVSRCYDIPQLVIDWIFSLLSMYGLVTLYLSYALSLILSVIYYICLPFVGGHGSHKVMFYSDGKRL